MTTLQKLADGAERTKAGFVIVIVTDDAKIASALDELDMTKHLVPTPPANRVCAVVDDDRWTWMIVNHTTPGDGGYVAIGVDTADFPGGKQGAVDFFGHAMMLTGIPMGEPKIVVVDQSGPLAVSTDDPNYTHEFVSYAMAHGRSPGSQLAHDREQYPGGCMTGFILWVGSRMKEFRKEHPEAFIGSNVVDQKAKQAFFRKRAQEGAR